MKRISFNTLSICLLTTYVICSNIIHLGDNKDTEKYNNSNNINSSSSIATNKISINQANVVTPVSKNVSEQIYTTDGGEPIGQFRHTIVIGTPDHPTIDGGIMNAADNTVVYKPVITKPTPTKIITTVINKPSTQIDTTNIHQFNTQQNSLYTDDWAVSDKVKNILDRAAASGKLSYVLQQSDNKGLPASVALLPIIESSYKDNAISPKGAEGSWQLMPKTALEEGIDPNTRTQFIPETNAALNLLIQLHQRFGSWALAYAAYNAGSVRVAKALAEDPTATSIDQLALPVETKNYVNSLMKINQSLIDSYQSQ